MLSDWSKLREQPGADFEFRCDSCGEAYRGAPSFAYDRPAYCFAIPEHERAERVILDADTCSIDNEHFFIRTTLEIPIAGLDQPFVWGVWVSQSRASFLRYIATFDSDQTGDGSFGWLAAMMPGYETMDTDGDWVYLACDVAWGGVDQRPSIRLHQTDHPLYRDQIDGISRRRAAELAKRATHGC